MIEPSSFLYSRGEHNKRRVAGGRKGGQDYAKEQSLLAWRYMQSDVDTAGSTGAPAGHHRLEGFEKHRSRLMKREDRRQVATMISGLGSGFPEQDDYANAARYARYMN